MTGFLSDQFRSAQFKPSTEKVILKVLSDFFPEGTEPEFEVRGLTASELQKALEAGEKQKQVDNVVKAIATNKDQIESIRRAIGFTSETPAEIAKRIELIVQGSVNPKLTHADAAKLAEVFPIEFYDLSNKITILTGQGGSRVKPQPSSQMTVA